MLKLLLVTSMILTSSCSSLVPPSPVTKKDLSQLPILQFEKIEAPVAPSLDAKVIKVDGQEYVAFIPEQAWSLRVYIKQLQVSLQKANITIESANDYIKRIHGQ